MVEWRWRSPKSDKESNKIQKKGQDQNEETSSGRGAPDVPQPQPEPVTLPHSEYIDIIERKAEYKRLWKEAEEGRQELSDLLSAANSGYAGLFSAFEDLKGQADALVPSLSPMDQAYIQEHEQPPPQKWILSSCANYIEDLKSHVNRLENEKAVAAMSFRKQFLEQKNLHETDYHKLEETHKIAVEKEEARTNEAHQKLGAEIDRLEKALLVSADDFQPISDRVFLTKFSALKKAVEGLARWCSDIREEELGKAFRQTNVTQYTPQSHGRLPIEGEFWEILMKGFFLTPFGVFGAYGEEVSTNWGVLFETEHDPNRSWPRPNVASERWRSITFEALRSTIRDNAGQLTTSYGLRSSYDQNIQLVTDGMTSTLRKFATQDKTTVILSIVDQARNLAFDFGGQRCRLQLFSHEMNEVVQKNLGTCKDANYDNGGEVHRGVVQLKVAPGLKRLGDGRGYSFQESTVLLPCTVYLQPIR